MTVSRISTDSSSEVTTDGHTLVIRDLRVTHAEAASYVRGQLDDHGPEAAADLVRRALPVGLVALAMGTAGLDTGALTRTLSAFEKTVGEKSSAALVGLDEALDRLRVGEEAVTRTAASILDGLPAQVEAALAGQATSVRASVADATRTVQTAGLQELTTALGRHSESVRNALSLDRADGPVRMLRQDLLDEFAGTRRELVEQLSGVRSLLEAAQVAKVAGAKSSRAVGAANEAEAMTLLEGIVTAAGDLFARVGDEAGTGGTTRRSGDGLITLSPAITGSGRQVRIVAEAKARTRPMSVRAHRDELAAACRVRDAAGGLTLVPTNEQVPGGGAFTRIDTCAYVVSCQDLGTAELIYLLLREQVAFLKVRASEDAEVDLAQVEARFDRALSEIGQLDEVGRLAVQAHKALEKLIALGRETQQRVRSSLTEGITLLH
ncbi:hypothetical protein [Nocardioides sp. AX2bis]|uniref:hypothetical protein n=1 Tax=Nocardioides sp. AX2bis TaxID=2653157 RepID=UPI0012F2CB38|nr:hypothetical protein [Nocardioides sp. AX2bis]VXB08361.1 conserved hypothetical protein [Nocardioides sp. AX2bis]